MNKKQVITWLVENVKWQVTNSGGIAARSSDVKQALTSLGEDERKTVEEGLKHLTFTTESNTMQEEAYYAGTLDHWKRNTQYFDNNHLAAAVLQSDAFKETLRMAIIDSSDSHVRKEALKLAVLRLLPELLEWKYERAANHPDKPGEVSKHCYVSDYEATNEYKRGDLMVTLYDTIVHRDGCRPPPQKGQDEDVFIAGFMPLIRQALNDCIPDDAITLEKDGKEFKQWHARPNLEESIRAFRSKQEEATRAEGEKGAGH